MPKLFSFKKYFLLVFSTSHDTCTLTLKREISNAGINNHGYETKDHILQ